MLQTLRKSLKDSFKERNELVDGLLVALIAKEPLFILGPPGTAKSLICETLCNSIQGNYFSWLCSKFTTPEELFGSISIQGLQQDKFKRVTVGKLPDADIAFLDEVFKGSSAILNTLLPIINERVFFNEGRQRIGLQTVFCASNEIPQAEELAALYDRLVLRYVVTELKSEDSFRSLITAGVQDSHPQISMEYLATLQEQANQMPLDQVVVDKVVEIRRAVKELGLYVSNRKWMQAIKVIKAFSLLQQHTKVEVEDLQILENVLWSSPDQIPEVRAMVRKLCNPVAEIISRHLDAASEQMALFKSGQIVGTQALELFKKLQHSKKELVALQQKNPREDLEIAIESISTDLTALSKTILG